MDEGLIKKISPYVTNATGNVFCVVNLPVGISGAVYARYSRAETGFRETLAREFLDENGGVNVSKADELIERVLNAYGDDSVGEQEGVHLSFEQVSNLATKIIEDKRIGGSPIEQSTRYVFYDKKDADGNFKYLREKKIMDSKFRGEFLETMDFAFQTYADLVEPMQEHFRKLKPINEAEYAIKPRDNKKYKLSELSNEKESSDFKRTYKFDIRTKACDTIRILLPTATLTNVGLYGNGRFFQGLLTALYSHELTEMQDLAFAARAELDKVIPAYVRRAGKDDYIVNKERNMNMLAKQLLKGLAPEPSEDVVLLYNIANLYLNDLVAQMIYKYAQHPLAQLRTFVDPLPVDKKLEIINTYLGERRNRRDRPGRALEVGYPFTFDLIADFGVYRDLHRERMKTQERQDLTTMLGRFIPDEIEEIGFKDRVIESFEKIESLHRKLLDEYPKEAQYVTLFGHNIRWSQGTNLREEMYEDELRTIPQGHPNYRRICQKKHDKIKEYNPLIADILKFVDHNNYYFSRAESEAKQRAKERVLDEKFKKNGK